jgi:hypothetical protein
LVSGSSALLLDSLRKGGVIFMTSTELFHWVILGWYILPCAAAVAVLIWVPVKSSYIRSAIAVAIGWILAVTYTMYIFNPAGIAAGYEQGVHFPENRYDNNTISATILSGWLYPLLVVAFYFLMRWTFRLVGARRGASNSKFKPDSPDGARL